MFNWIRHCGCFGVALYQDCKTSMNQALLMFNRVWNRHFALFLYVSFLNLDTPRRVTKIKRKQKKWANWLLKHYYATGTGKHSIHVWNMYVFYQCKKLTFFCKFYFLIGNAWEFQGSMHKAESGYLSKPALKILSISVTFTKCLSVQQDLGILWSFPFRLFTFLGEKSLPQYLLKIFSTKWLPFLFSYRQQMFVVSLFVVWKDMYKNFHIYWQKTLLPV